MTNYNPQYPPQQPPYGQPPYGQPPYGMPPGYGYAPPPAKSTNWALIIVLVCAVPLLGLIVAIVLPALNAARERANRVKCSANLRMIGQATMMYQSTYAQYPPSLAYLVTTGNLQANYLVCPSSSDTAPTGSTLPQLEQSISLGNCSYIYLGRNVSMRSPYGCVLAYEKDANHNTRNGMNVLLTDGSVQWIEAPQARQVARELRSGQNPPLSLSGFNPR